MAEGVSFDRSLTIFSRLCSYHDRDRRGWRELTRRGFDAQRGPQGALLIGDPDDVVEKIVRHSATSLCRMRSHNVTYPMVAGDTPA